MLVTIHSLIKYTFGIRLALYATRTSVVHHHRPSSTQLEVKAEVVFLLEKEGYTTVNLAVTIVLQFWNPAIPTEGL